MPVGRSQLVENLTTIVSFDQLAGMYFLQTFSNKTKNFFKYFMPTRLLQPLAVYIQIMRPVVLNGRTSIYLFLTKQGKGPRSSLTDLIDPVMMDHVGTRISFHQFRHQQHTEATDAQADAQVSPTVIFPDHFTQALCAGRGHSRRQADLSYLMVRSASDPRSMKRRRVAEVQAFHACQTLARVRDIQRSELDLPPLVATNSSPASHTISPSPPPSSPVSRMAREPWNKKEREFLLETAQNYLLAGAPISFPSILSAGNTQGIWRVARTCNHIRR
jgi:hypothetical protein